MRNQQESPSALVRATPGGKDGARRRSPKTALYIVVLFAIFAGPQYLTHLKRETVAPKNGFADLSGLDLSRNVARVARAGWEFYPGHLYTPEDFARGVPDGTFSDNSPVAAEYGTYRLVLALPPGKIYTLSGRSLPFAQRLFVDGRLENETGTPGTTRADTSPRVGSYLVDFLPAGTTTELVFQVANFHHSRGRHNTPFDIADPVMIARVRTLDLIGTNVVVGCLLMATVYLLGVFVFFASRRQFLFLSLACLTTVLRMLLSGQKYIAEVFPGLDWAIAIRADYLCTIFFVIFFLLYFAHLYPGMLSKPFVAAAIGASGLYALYVLFADTRHFTRLLSLYIPFWIAASTAVLWRLAQRLRRGDAGTALIFAGLAVLVGASLFDEVAFRFFTHVRMYNLLVASLLAYVFMNMIALTLTFSETENELIAARNLQRELNETNRLLDRLNLMKTQFMDNLSHEMKTPLTVISTHAQLAKALIASNATRGAARRGLDVIIREAGRLARMVTGMLELGAMREARGGMGPVDVGEVLRNAAGAYRAVFEKKGNKFIPEIPAGLPPVRGDADMLTQVMFNLFSNADSHTGNGEIAVSAAVVGDRVAVTVRDNGIGMEPGLLPRVFERRVRDGDSDGAGLGLAICRSIVERHGGTIEIDSVLGGGTEVRFALPIMTGDA